MKISTPERNALSILADIVRYKRKAQNMRLLDLSRETGVWECP